jgi:hypothetical protein
MGYVYLIEDIDNNRYKIGVTKNLKRRLKNLQTGNSNQIKLIDSFETEYPFRLETMLHNRFNSFHYYNEWYDLDEESIKNFSNLCNELNNIIISLKDNHFFSKKLS